MVSLQQELMENSYPGRGIVLGKSGNGKYAVSAYFIMGRSVNSRNRIFVQDGEGIRTQAFLQTPFMQCSELSQLSFVLQPETQALEFRTSCPNGWNP